MRHEIELFPTDTKSYFELARKMIAVLPSGSMVFIDVDGTAIISSRGSVFVRDDFHQLHSLLKTLRPDLSLRLITYRSRTHELAELAAYEFDSVIYFEDMLSIVPARSIDRKAMAMDYLGKISRSNTLEPEIIFDDSSLVESAIKVLFLLLMFNSTMTQIFLIDDGIDGIIAERYGFGMKVES